MLFGKELRKQFPIFSLATGQELGQNPSESKKYSGLCYLDSAASAQKPKVVIDEITEYLSHHHANVHRGAYRLSADATERFETVRKKVAAFISCASERNIIFTKGATDSINLAAYSIEDQLQPGDLILLSYLEHHSNIVPWQILAKRKNLKITFIEIKENGELDMADFKSKLSGLKPKVVSITALANAIGTLTPIEEIISESRKIQALTLVDASQYCAHKAIDVTKLGCDFLAFSSHKLYGPTGCGVLYCSDRALELMSPVYGGGEMISTVTTEGSTWADIPHRFEAGTPAIAEVIGFGPAVDFASEIIAAGVSDFEKKIFNEFYQAMQAIDGISLYGPGSDKQSSIITFNLKGIHPHDLASIADSFNVQIRAGHHCAQPLMARLGLNATARVSLACYSDNDQIAPLIEALKYAQKVFG